MRPAALPASKWRFVVSFDKPIVYADYTGKLVRTILATASPVFREAIAERPRGMVKGFSVSPLYLELGDGRVRALYPRARGPGEPWSPVTVEPGRLYYFHVSAAADLEQGVHEALTALAAGLVVGTRSGPVRVTLHEARMLARYSPGEPVLELRPGDEVKLVLRSPTLPSSPLHPGSRVKRLTASPLHLLATNILALYRGPRPEALAAADLLTPSPSALETLRIVWYVYEARTLPGLAGYVKYRVDDTVEATRGQLEILSQLLSHAAVMGTGTGRAAGFGDTTVEKREG